MKTRAHVSFITLFGVFLASGWLTLAQAQDQNVNGNLTVTGSATVTGTLSISGMADFNHNTTNFGTNGLTPSTPGVVLTYTDTASGTISTITLATGGTTAIWQWERNSANGLIPQMTLTGTNSLILWNPTNSTSAAITLNPAGDSTFAGSLVATGTNSQLPNQTLTSSGSIVTRDLGDARYLQIGDATSNFVSLSGNQTITGNETFSGNLTTTGNINMVLPSDSITWFPNIITAPAKNGNYRMTSWQVTGVGEVARLLSDGTFHAQNINSLNTMVAGTSNPLVTPLSVLAAPGGSTGASLTAWGYGSNIYAATWLASIDYLGGYWGPRVVLNGVRTDFIPITVNAPSGQSTFLQKWSLNSVTKATLDQYGNLMVNSITAPRIEGKTYMDGDTAVSGRLNVSGISTFSNTIIASAGIRVAPQGDISMGDFTSSGAVTGVQTAQSLLTNYANALATQGVTLSAAETTNILNFLTGLDNIVGLDRVVECWTLRGTQNAGTGTTVYGLLGKYNGTLVNGPTWDTNGIIMSTGTNAGYVALSCPELDQVSVSTVFTTATVGGELFVYKDLDFRLGDGTMLASAFDTNNGGGVANTSIPNYTTTPIFLGASANHLTGVYSIWSSLGFVTGSKMATRNTSQTAIGGSGSSAAFSLKGTISFSVAFSTILTAQQYSDIYSLYKTTIGQGLGLP